MGEECIHSPLEVMPVMDGTNTTTINQQSAHTVWCVCMSVVVVVVGRGGASGGGGHLLTFFFSSFIFDVGSHHPLAGTAPRFSCTFFSPMLPKQRSQQERKAICGHHSQADVYVTLSCHPKTCNNILPCPHFTYCTERSLCKLLRISSATSLTRAVVRFRMSLTKMVRSIHVAIIACPTGPVV